MLFNRNFNILSFTCQLAMLLNWKFACFYFFLIFCVIQREIDIFLLFCRFSMSFNGKFAFCQFSFLFNEKLQGGMYRRTYGRTYISFSPVSYRTLALWGRCPKSIQNAHYFTFRPDHHRQFDACTNGQWTDGQSLL